MKKMEIKDLKQVVLNVLENSSMARNDDFVLYYQVCYELDYRISTRNFKTIMLNHLEYSLPSFESVTRLRRKICETREDLKPTLKMQRYRLKKEEEVREWIYEE